MMLELFKHYAKGAAAFIFAVLANAVSDLISGQSPWPQTTAEWARYLISAFGAAIVVGGVPNKLNEKQVTSGLKKLGPEATERAVNNGAPEVLVGRHAKPDVEPEIAPDGGE